MFLLYSCVMVFSHLVTHSHSAGHTVQLGGLQPHPLDNTQHRPPLWWGQGALGQHLVTRDKVQLDGSLVVLQGQQALPHDWIFLRK